jgi:uncharacterized protein
MTRPLRLLLPLAIAVFASTATAKKELPPPAPPTPATPSVSLGVEKWRSGDYPAAVAIWAPFADSGDPEALFNMGQAYKLGRGVPADLAKARDYYRKAANLGSRPAQANLGMLLFQAGEKPEAVQWLAKAADAGDPRAQYVLGVAAFNGDGVRRNIALGYAYVVLASRAGLPQATTTLAAITPGMGGQDRANGDSIVASVTSGAGVPPQFALVTGPRLIPNTIPAAPAQVTASDVLKPLQATTSTTTTVTTTNAPKPQAVAPAPKPAASSAGSTASIGTVVKPSVVAVAPGPKPAIAPVIVPPAAATVAPPPATQTASSGAPMADATPAPSKPAPMKAARTSPSKLVEVAAKPPAKSTDTTKPVHKDWRIQLGAFSTQAKADAALADLKAGKGLTGAAKPVFETGGGIVKLQIGPYASKDAARAACDQLSEAGRACFLVAPAG